MFVGLVCQLSVTMQQSGFWNVHSECDKKRSWGLFASQDTTIGLIQQQTSYDLILKYPPQPFKQNSTGQLLGFCANQYRESICYLSTSLSLISKAATAGVQKYGCSNAALEFEERICVQAAWNHQNQWLLSYAPPVLFSPWPSLVFRPA